MKKTTIWGIVMRMILAVLLVLMVMPLIMLWTS